MSSPEIGDKWMKMARQLMILASSELHHECCEITPSIADDSKQPEWNHGELTQLINVISRVIKPHIASALQAEYERGWNNYRKNVLRFAEGESNE